MLHQFMYTAAEALVIYRCDGCSSYINFVYGVGGDLEASERHAMMNYSKDIQFSWLVRRLANGK